MGPRASGRTTATIEAANKIGATVVAAGFNHAKALRAMGAKKVIAFESDSVEGTTGPYLFDHFTLERVALLQDSRITQLQQKLNHAEDALSRILNIAAGTE